MKIPTVFPDGSITMTDFEEQPMQPEPAPTLEERVGSLEKSKANQADVDELNEALNMILTGATQ